MLPPTSRCPVGDDNPTARPSAANTGPPDPPAETTSVQLTALGLKSGTSMMYRFASVEAGGTSQTTGTGRMPSTADGWTRTTATSRAASATITVPLTFTGCETCTSTEVRSPGPRARSSSMALRLVAMSPRSSARKPAACACGVQSPKALACQVLRMDVACCAGAFAAASAGRSAVAAPVLAFDAVSSSSHVPPQLNVDRLRPLVGVSCRTRRDDPIPRCTCPAAGGFAPCRPAT